MKLKQIIILLAVLAAVVGALVLSKKGADDGLDEAVGKKIFPKLVTEDVTSVVLNGGKEEVTLEIKDGKWTVKGRDGFPANADFIDSVVKKAALIEAADVKAEVAEKYLGRFKLQKPGTGGKDDETGTQVTLKKGDGSVLASFVIGKTANNSAGMGGYSNAQPQYIKNDEAQDKVFTIKEGFDYYMNSITNKDWIDKANFFKVEKPKSITVTSDKAEDNWKLFREKEGTDATELKLADVKPGEEFDTSKAANSGSAFGAVTFVDVATADLKDKTGMDKPLRTAVIETFDGFKYTIKIGKMVEKEVDPNAGASEEYYVSVDVEANLVEKFPEPVPTPEDAKKSEEEKKKAREAAEKAFNDTLAKNKEKLAKEKALAGKTYIIAKYNVNPLLMNRSEFMKEKAASPAPADGSTPAAQPQPAPNPTPAPAATTTPKREPITATTPPISVDIKPSTDAKPAVEMKPKEPAPKVEVKLPEEAAKPAPAPTAPAPAAPAAPAEPAKEEKK